MSGWKVPGHELPDPIRYMNPDTGEIREREGGFSALIEDRDQAEGLLYRIAEALGADVARRWQDRGPESVDLVAEVRRLAAGRRSHGIEPPTPVQREAQAEAYRRLADQDAADLDDECAHCHSDIRRGGDYPCDTAGRVFCCYGCADMFGAELTPEWVALRMAEDTPSR